MASSQTSVRNEKDSGEESFNTVADRMVALARYIESRPDEPLSLADLGALVGLSASRVQRVFKENFGVSPKAFQDALRLKHFKQAMRTGQTVTGAIYEAGFGSVSRIYGKADRQVGMSPSRYGKGGEGETIAFSCRETSLGLLMMAATDQGVCFAEFGENEKTLQDRLQKEFPKARLHPSEASQSPELDAWIKALDEHLSQNKPRPDVPLDIRGTAFQARVWKLLLSVREGEVITYTELARRLGQPRAVRAVASACGRNRITVLIPCHRILRSDGSLGGYRWGLDRKRKLLEKEKSKSQT
jgi:AraC family transcriptional regulator of adaptative response/methylated-DNA-[protein]-cysteine methyltransferase